jgi:translation initiation factor 4E
MSSGGTAVASAASVGLQALNLGGGTPLHHAYTFTVLRRCPRGKEEKKDENNPYESAIKTIATVATVEEFWMVYDYLKRPNDIPSTNAMTTEYHLFRAGIKPVWEDTNNAAGGKWMIRLPKGLASRYWEEILLALVGAQFHGVADGEVCGAVLSIR